MGQITVEKNVGGIEGLCVITPAVHGDSRGYFMETYNQKDMEEAGFRSGQSVQLHKRRSARPPFSKAIPTRKTGARHPRIRL